MIRFRDSEFEDGFFDMVDRSTSYLVTVTLLLSAACSLLCSLLSACLLLAALIAHLYNRLSFHESKVESRKFSMLSGAKCKAISLVDWLTAKAENQI